jgi:hypothetical protein
MRTAREIVEKQRKKYQNCMWYGLPHVKHVLRIVRFFQPIKGWSQILFPLLADCRAAVPNLGGKRGVSNLLVYNDCGSLNIQRFCMVEPRKKDPDQFNPIEELRATIALLYDCEPEKISP